VSLVSKNSPIEYKLRVLLLHHCAQRQCLSNKAVSTGLRFVRHLVSLVSLQAREAVTFLNAVVEANKIYFRELSLWKFGASGRKWPLILLSGLASIARHLNGIIA
jgi:hypothetical protein